MLRLEWAAVLAVAIAGYLFLAGLYAGSAVAMQVAAIWTAHIAMDRVLGYGLKLPTGFSDTHLGRIGRGR